MNKFFTAIMSAAFFLTTNAAHAYGPAVTAVLVKAVAADTSAAAAMTLAGTATPEEVETAKKLVRISLKDPESANFKNIVKLGTDCLFGEVNAKNGYGGYGGYTAFYIQTSTFDVLIVGSGTGAYKALERMEYCDNERVKAVYKAATE